MRAGRLRALVHEGSWAKPETRSLLEAICRSLIQDGATNMLNISDRHDQEGAALPIFVLRSAFSGMLKSF
eukprot:4049422-Pyramimonas_sp.AAC.1